MTFDESVPGNIVAPINEGGYRHVLLAEPPLSINVQLQLPDGEDGEGIESLTDDAIVVPILISRHTQEGDTTSLFSCMKGNS